MRGGDTKFTRGSTSRVCTDVQPVPGVEAGAFVDPARFWSTASTVEFGGTHYGDGKPRIVDLRAPCCRSEHRWPKCWADDTGRRGDHDLDSIKADARSLAGVGILHASLEGNVLSLRCARGPGTGQYAESVGAFQWKRMPDSTNEVRNVTSSAVVVRCECSRGLLQRLREFIQLHMHKFYLPWQKSFLARYWLESEQCVGSDLILVQATERPGVRERMKRIWSPGSTDETGGRQPTPSPVTKPTFLNIMYVFMDSTSRRNWNNNARETTRVLRQMALEQETMTFGFPFFHTLGHGTTERAYTAAFGGSRIANFGDANFAEWTMLNRVWDRARDAGWFTSISSETCFAHEHRSLFHGAPSNMNMSLADKMDALGDHAMFDAFCGRCDAAVEEFCDSGKRRVQYRNGDYYTKNFLADERSCEGGRRPSSNFLEFTRKAFDLYSGEFPSLHIYEWASAHLFREEDHVCAAMRHFDGSLSAFLRDLRRAGLMNRTVLILAGDHGNWNMEENTNPGVSVTVPLWWLAKQDVTGAMHGNQREVVTHLDLHATMMDLIRRQTGPSALDSTLASAMPKEGEPQLPASALGHIDARGWHGWRYGMKDFPGRTLFRPLGADRGCATAGVDSDPKHPEYCMVSKTRKGEVEDVKPAIEAAVAYRDALVKDVIQFANRGHEKYSSVCLSYGFDELRSATARPTPTADGLFQMLVIFLATPFSAGAGRREFRCDVLSKANPFELELAAAENDMGEGGQAPEITVSKCKQVTKWGMNKDCMPKGIEKDDQEFCQCLDDEGLTIEGFRL